MRWLVTGASGLLGGYVLRNLHAAGETVVAWSGSHPRESSASRSLAWT